MAVVEAEDVSGMTSFQALLVVISALEGRSAARNYARVPLVNACLSLGQYHLLGLRGQW